jgi:hypothetical protein
LIGWLADGCCCWPIADFIGGQSLKWQLRRNLADFAVYSLLNQNQVRCLNLGRSMSECAAGSSASSLFLIADQDLVTRKLRTRTSCET